MTMALCFRCGDTKFGALCPCPKCKTGSSGNVGLDVAFSDWFMAPKNIEQFGDAIRSINSVCQDESKRVKAFFRYVQKNYSIVNLKFPDDVIAELDEIILKANPPVFTLEDKRKRRE